MSFQIKTIIFRNNMGVKLFQFQEHFELLTFNSLFKLSKALKTEKK